MNVFIFIQFRIAVPVVIWVCTVCLCPKNGTLGLYGLIMGSTIQRTKTIKICNQLYKKPRKIDILMIFPKISFTTAISISQIDLLVFKLTADKNMIWA